METRAGKQKHSPPTPTMMLSPLHILGKFTASHPTSEFTRLTKTFVKDRYDVVCSDKCLYEVVPESQGICHVKELKLACGLC